MSPNNPQTNKTHPKISTPDVRGTGFVEPGVPAGALGAAISQCSPT